MSDATTAQVKNCCLTRARARGVEHRCPTLAGQAIPQGQHAQADVGRRIDLAREAAYRMRRVSEDGDP